MSPSLPSLPCIDSPGAGREQDEEVGRVVPLAVPPQWNLVTAATGDQGAIAVAEAIDGLQDDDLGPLREATVLVVESGSSNGQQEVIIPMISVTTDMVEQQERQEGGQQQKFEDDCGATDCAKIIAALLCTGVTGLVAYFAFLVVLFHGTIFGGSVWDVMLAIGGFVVTLAFCMSFMRCLFCSPTRQQTV